MLLVRNYLSILVLAGWLLLLAGCGPAQSETPLAPLQQAVAENNVEALTALLASGTNPDSGEPRPLLLAVERNSGAAAEVLLLAGAQTEVRNEDGLRPLDIAVQQGRGAFASLLLRYGALPDPDRSRTDTTTVICAPLFVATQRGDVALVDLLLSRGADPQLPCGPQRPADVAPTSDLAERLRNAVLEVPGL